MNAIMSERLKSSGGAPRTVVLVANGDLRLVRSPRGRFASHARTKRDDYSVFSHTTSDVQQAICLQRLQLDGG